MANSIAGIITTIITMAAGLVPMLPLSKKKSGTPMSAPLPKQMSCRFVRLNNTLVLTLVKSLEIPLYKSFSYRSFICAGYKAEAGLRLPVQHLPPAKPAQLQPAARRLLPLSLSSV